jgi:hypothetical protein
VCRVFRELKVLLVQVGLRVLKDYKVLRDCKALKEHRV